ncbi:DUF1934 domain-containing protein [Ruminococcaceae bacterium OttesenSCG-928-L11]|nr:DUF1934 domain-containing protein [Ruminococcaceae bacterium OttesenSCG-928-L11]
MKKDVLISIKGKYAAENEAADVIELITTGQYYKKNGHYYISYEESEATGFQGSRTTLKVENEDRVTMERSGEALAQLIVQKGVRHQCRYDIGYGDMTIGVSGGQIRSSLGDSGGKLEFTYSLDINSLLASENEMVIQIEEAGAGKRFELNR